MNGKVSGEELGKIEERGKVIRMYYARKKSTLDKSKKNNNKKLNLGITLK